MAPLDTDFPAALIDVTGLSLPELDTLGGSVFEESLREVLAPARGETAAAGFTSRLAAPPNASATPA